jgi:hypothetical protein
VCALTGRGVRTTVLSTLRMCAPRVWAGSPEDEASSRATAAVLAEHHEERQLRFDADGNVVVGLKPGIRNDLRLQWKAEELATAGRVRAEDVVKYMSNAMIISTSSRQGPRSPQWDAVLAAEKVVVPSLHLLAEELPPVDLSGNGGLSPTFLRAGRYTHIASTVPPEFVTKAGYRTTHSLTPAAFEYLHDRVHQLMVVQQLARLDPRRLQKRLSLCTHVDALLGGTGVRMMDAVGQAVTVIAALVAVLGREHADVSVLTEGPPAAQEEGLPVAIAPAAGGTAVRDKAYAWAAKHWRVIRTMPSKNCQPARQIPGRDDTTQWHACLRRVLTEHAGLNWRARKKGTTRFGPTPLSLWTKLGIDQGRYTAWYRSPAGQQFGIIPQALRRCAECNGAGDEVWCLRQNNMWRCAESPTDDSHPHRQPLEPLDVAAAPEDAAEQKERTGSQQSTCPARRPGVAGVLDSLVGHLGFAGGAAVGNLGVSASDMQLAWADAVVHPEDQATIMGLYGVDLSTVVLDRSCMRTTRMRVNAVLRQEHLQLTLSRPRDAAAAVGMYRLTAHS